MVEPFIGLQFKFDAGCITTKELGTVLRAVGKSPTDAEIKVPVYTIVMFMCQEHAFPHTMQKITSDIDSDGRGLLDFQEVPAPRACRKLLSHCVMLCLDMGAVSLGHD